MSRSQRTPDNRSIRAWRMAGFSCHQSVIRWSGAFMANAPRLVLVDGSSSLYRAFFALPPLSNSKGTPTHAILGFTTMLLKLLREEDPEALAVAFDGPGPTTRHLEYPKYKAQRPEMPESMEQQIPPIHRVLAAMRVPVLMMAAEEADDILGTSSRRASCPLRGPCDRRGMRSCRSRETSLPLR